MNFKISYIIAIAFFVIVGAILIARRQRVKETLNGFSNELKKVVWPTKEKVWAQTIVIVVSLVIVAIFFGGIDYFLNLGIATIFNH